MLALTVTVTSIEEKGRGYFLFRCHQFPLHAWRARTCNAHTHTTDRFIIACQESAGFTFQQNGPIWRANCCIHPSPHRTLRYLSPHPAPLNSPLSPTSPPPSRRASPLSRIHNGTEYMFLSQASRQLFLFLFFFNASRRNWGRTGHSDSRNHSVWILNVLPP